MCAIVMLGLSYMELSFSGIGIGSIVGTAIGKGHYCIAVINPLSVHAQRGYSSIVSCVYVLLIILVTESRNTHLKKLKFSKTSRIDSKTNKPT